MSLNWKFNLRLKMFATKATTAAMATLLLASQTPGFAGSASAAQAEQLTAATTGENEQLDATSNDVPEGAKISSRQASENILKLFPLLKKQRSHLHDSIHLIPIHRQNTRRGRSGSRLHKAIIRRDSVELYMQAQGKC